MNMRSSANRSSPLNQERRIGLTSPPSLRLTRGATPVDGYYAFGFDGVGDAVEQTSRQADVLAIGGKAYSCGDYGGMPVQRSDGSPADRLGTNIPAIARVLRRW